MDIVQKPSLITDKLCFGPRLQHYFQGKAPLLQRKLSVSSEERLVAGWAQFCAGAVDPDGCPIGTVKGAVMEKVSLI